MTKVVRAFSLDQSVSEDLDYYTRVPGRMKPMNKSKYVNAALKFYMRPHPSLKTVIEENQTLKKNLTAGLRAKDVSIQGLKQQLAVSHQCEIDKMEEIGDLKLRLARLRVKLDCRCLWCRLKRRLQK